MKRIAFLIAFLVGGTPAAGVAGILMPRLTLETGQDPLIRSILDGDLSPVVAFRLIDQTPPLLPPAIDLPSISLDLTDADDGEPASQGLKDLVSPPVVSDDRPWPERTGGPVAAEGGQALVDSSGRMDMIPAFSFLIGELVAGVDAVRGLDGYRETYDRGVPCPVGYGQPGSAKAWALRVSLCPSDRTELSANILGSYRQVDVTRFGFGMVGRGVDEEDYHVRASIGGGEFDLEVEDEHPATLLSARFTVSF